MIYLTEGNIPLNAAYDDNIIQEANSTYQLTFKFPTNNVLWQRLREEKFLTADDLHGEQDFVIFEIEKQHGYIQVYANQVMTLLNNYVVNPINLDYVTGSTVLSQFAGSITRSNPFSFFSDINYRHTFNTDTKNAMEVLTKDKHSILGQWGGDLVRHGYQVRLLKNGGSENESLFMYKKNLTSYQHKSSTKSLKTRITFTTTVKGEGENADDKHYKVVVDSRFIEKYSQVYEDVVEVNDQDVKDEASLRMYGVQYFLTSLCDLMEDNIEIDVVGQSDVPVQMFDVVSIYHETFDLDVRKKITKYTYSPMAKKLKSIGFGEFKSGLANAIGNVVSDAVKSETQQFQSNFERQLAREIKNADLAFDRKKEELTNQFTDEVNAINAKAEENKRALSDEIDRRFHDFSPEGFDEAKTKAEEALKKASASDELAKEAKKIADDNVRDLNVFKTNAQNEREKLSDELKRYSREETNSQIVAIRERLSSDYVAKSTFTETVESTNQRFETLKRDNDIKLADYKQGIDGRITDIASQVSGKVNEADFQRVKETSQLYERVLGNTEQGLPDKISRLVMTNEIFQTEVNDLVVSDNNLIVNSETLDKHTIVNRRNNVNVEVQNGIFTINAQGLTGYNWGGFTLPIYVPKILKGEVYTLGFKYKIRRQLDHEFCVVIKNHSRNKAVLQKIIANPQTSVSSGWQEFQGTFKMTEDLDFDQVGNFPIYFYLVKNGLVEIKEPMLVRGPRTGSFKPSQFDEAYRNVEATRTQVTQLAGSYAIKALNSAGDIIAGINVGANGNNRIIGRATHITGETLIDNAVIKSAMIDKLKTANFEAGSVTTNILGAEAVTADKVKFDTAFIQQLVSQQAFINELFAKQATITQIQSIDFTGNHIKGGRISSLNGETIFDLQSGWLKMNGEGVGIFNQFDSRPIQYLVFHKGAINGKLGSYTALMSNSHGWVNMDDGSAGIQIWNTNDNTTAINLYGDEIAMMYNATDQRGIIFDNVKNEIRNVDKLIVSNLNVSDLNVVSNLKIRNHSLVDLMNLINQNFIGIENWFKRNKLGSPGRYDVRI